MLGDQVSADFYIKWLDLSHEEQEKLHALTVDGELLEKIAQDYVLVWRNRQKAATPVVYIRRLILMQAAMTAVKYSFDRECSYRVELAFALWLCERVEHHASKLEKMEGLSGDTSPPEGG